MKHEMTPVKWTSLKKGISIWVRREWQRVGHEYQSQVEFAQTYAELIPKRFRDVTGKPVQIDPSVISEDWLAGEST